MPITTQEKIVLNYSVSKLIIQEQLVTIESKLHLKPIRGFNETASK